MEYCEQNMENPGNEKTASLNYGSELEGTDVEDSDAEDESYNPHWPKLVRATYTTSDDDDKYDEFLEEVLNDSGSEDSSSGSEVDEDRLSKCVYRESYSDSDESMDDDNLNRNDTNKSASKTQINSDTLENLKFEWKPLDTQNFIKNSEKKEHQPDSKRLNSKFKNVTSDVDIKNKGDIPPGVNEGAQNSKIGEITVFRREKFTITNIGPTKSYTNAYDAFTSIWDEKIMKHIVRETNRYAHQVKEDQWQDTTVNEMYIYLGIIISTTILVQPIKEYWYPQSIFDSKSQYPYLMPYERFKQLTNCLHFNDNDKLNEEKNKFNHAQAKLYKIQPLVDLLNEKFSSLYTIAQDIILDEGLTQWKGWIVNTRRICIDPDPVEIKSLEVCEPNTGYLWHLKLIPDDITTEMVPELVAELLKGLEGKGYTIWIDKFYASPILARQLKQFGFDCAGLVKKSHLPIDLLKKVTSSKKKRDRNISEIHGCTSGDVDILAWVTKNRWTNFITTFEQRTAESSKTPKVIEEYYKHMQGIHRKDNLLFKFPMERKNAHVWYKMFFRKLLNASLLNAHILYNRKDMKHYKFRIELSNQIFNRHRSKSPSASFPPDSEEYHLLAQYSLVENQKQILNNCSVCPKMTEWYCYLCKFPLCEKGCFDKFHSYDDEHEDDDDDCDNDSDNKTL